MLGLIKRMIKKNRKISDLVDKLYAKVKERRQAIPQKPFVHEYSVSEIVICQTLAFGYFNRLDTIIRLLAVENEYGLNDHGWELYRKMQRSRLGEDDDRIEERVSIFRELIRSWESGGYDNRSYIVLDKDLNIIDGSHRLALGIYNGIDNLNCKVIPESQCTGYGMDWLMRNDFSVKEMQIIDDKLKDVLNRYRIRTSILLWPAVSHYHDEIESKLNYLGDVEYSRDITYSAEELTELVQDIYGSIGMDQWKIDRKKGYLITDLSRDYVVRYISFIPDTVSISYRQNGNLKNDYTDAIKLAIRECYKDKIEEYNFDIICHAGDDAIQNEHIDRLCRTYEKE